MSHLPLFLVFAVFAVFAPALAGLASPSGDGAAQASRYPAFLEAQRAREALARRCEIRFSQAGFAGGAQQPSSLTFGLRREAEGLEAWVRWRARVADLPEAPELCDLDAVQATLAALASPGFDLSDGERVASFGPSREDPLLWVGRLSAAWEATHLEGMLTCGFVLNNRWLSEVLAEHRLVDERRDGERTTFVLELAEPGRWKERLVVEVGGAMELERLAWTRGNWQGLDARILASSEVEGMLLPARAVVVHGRGGVRIEGCLAYGPGGLPPALRSLTSLPQHIGAQGGAALVRDERTGRDLRLGDAAVLARADARRRGSPSARR